MHKGRNTRPSNPVRGKTCGLVDTKAVGGTRKDPLPAFEFSTKKKPYKAPQHTREAAKP